MKKLVRITSIFKKIYIFWKAVLWKAIEIPSWSTVAFCSLSFNKMYVWLSCKQNVYFLCKVKHGPLFSFHLGSFHKNMTFHHTLLYLYLRYTLKTCPIHLIMSIRVSVLMQAERELDKWILRNMLWDKYSLVYSHNPYKEKDNTRVWKIYLNSFRGVGRWWILSGSFAWALILNPGSLSLEDFLIWACLIEKGS